MAEQKKSLIGTVLNLSILFSALLNIFSHFFMLIEAEAQLAKKDLKILIIYSFFIFILLLAAWLFFCLILILCLMQFVQINLISACVVCLLLNIVFMMIVISRMSKIKNHFFFPETRDFLKKLKI